MAKKSTLKRVTDTVKDAASAVVHAADARVVQPVGKALGLISRKSVKKKASNKPTRMTLTKSLGKKTGKKLKTESTKAKMNTSTKSGKVKSIRKSELRGR